MNISHNERAKSADDLFFGLELQGTDGKAAALIYLNGSMGPYLLSGFSSDFFFQWEYLAESPLQSLVRNFFFRFSSVLFSPLFILPFLSWSIINFNLKIAGQSWAVLQRDGCTWRCSEDCREQAGLSPLSLSPGTVGAGEQEETSPQRAAQLTCSS